MTVKQTNIISTSAGNFYYTKGLEASKIGSMGEALSLTKVRGEKRGGRERAFILRGEKIRGRRGNEYSHIFIIIIIRTTSSLSVNIVKPYDQILQILIFLLRMPNVGVFFLPSKKGF